MDFEKKKDQVTNYFIVSDHKMIAFTKTITKQKNLCATG